MRDSILIYRSQIDALRNLPAEQFKAAVLAIAAYGMDGLTQKATRSSLRWLGWSSR